MMWIYGSAQRVDRALRCRHWSLGLQTVVSAVETAAHLLVEFLLVLFTRRTEVVLLLKVVVHFVVLVGQVRIRGQTIVIAELFSDLPIGASHRCDRSIVVQGADGCAEGRGPVGIVAHGVRLFVGELTGA